MPPTVSEAMDLLRLAPEPISGAASCNIAKQSAVSSVIVHHTFRAEDSTHAYLFRLPMARGSVCALLDNLQWATGRAIDWGAGVRL